MRIPSTQRYADAFRTGCLSQHEKATLQTLYRFASHSATARQTSNAMGYRGYSKANQILGSAGHKVCKLLHFVPLEHNPTTGRPLWLLVLVAAEKRDPQPGELLWEMHKPVVQALEKIGWAGVLRQIEVLPDEKLVPGSVEGNRVAVLVNRYERSIKERRRCLRKHGLSCKACSMNFKQHYGGIGKEFIHVHHVVPISKTRGRYVLDGARDLVPVCPNCHAMLHRREPPFSIRELKKRMKAVVRRSPDRAH
jgi:5-methylcytosine-specific restriction enzyme A